MSANRAEKLKKRNRTLPQSGNSLSKTISEAKPDWISVAVFSFAINVLMLTGPVFMLQVYDRVLTSRSIQTLLTLYILIVILFSFLGIFTFFRSRILSRLGFRIEEDSMLNAQKMRIEQGLSNTSFDHLPVADISRIRQFVSSNSLTAFFDLPWVPIYVGVVFYMNVWLGWLTVGGVLVITCFTIMNETITKNRLSASTAWQVKSANFSNSTHRNAPSIVSMGMMNRVLGHWGRLKRRSLADTQKIVGIAEIFTSISKSIRMLLQSSILGLGAYLAVFQIITPGTMIAASIIGGRALQPIDQVIAGWRQFIGAKQAYDRMSTLLDKKSDVVEKISLAKPRGYLNVKNLLKLSPAQTSQNSQPILQGLNFELEPGDGLGVIGPSAAGKSSLARLLTGLWVPDRGTVRLDGATYDQWNRESLGEYIGYLPQSVELIAGTIKENISRFEADASDADVIAAAEAADVDHLIKSLPGGYDAVVGDEVTLSGGQMQRIALARALYKMPSLVVLDEPNSNLDSDGDQALTRAIKKVRDSGSTVVVMAHRPSAIASVNKVLILKDGIQIEFGNRDEMIQKVRGGDRGLKGQIKSSDLSESRPLGILQPIQKHSSHRSKLPSVNPTSSIKNKDM